jgi:hypothetical protein
MKPILFAIRLAVLVLALAAANAWGQDEAPLLPPEELDALVGPIALYPDPLIAQILPAATFVDQIEDAAAYVRRNGTGRIDYQPWDLSVRAVAHYPEVLYLMADRYDWTTALGQAYVNQPSEVMDSIQRLRSAAMTEGNLYTTPQQEVIEEPEAIRIVPAVPEYIYVPVYDPQVVYFSPPDPGFAFITFSTGFFIGAWLNRDCDWRRHRVYYHGWRGGGWITQSRPVIRDRSNIYINRSARTIRVNNRIVDRDTHRVRQELSTQSRPFRELGITAPGERRRPEWRERQRERLNRGSATGGEVRPTAPATPPATRQNRRSGPAGVPPATVAPPAPRTVPAPAVQPTPGELRRSHPQRHGGAATGGEVGRTDRGRRVAPGAAAPAPAPSVRRHQSLGVSNPRPIVTAPPAAAIPPAARQAPQPVRRAPAAPRPAAPSAAPIIRTIPTPPAAPPRAFSPPPAATPPRVVAPPAAVLRPALPAPAPRPAPVERGFGRGGSPGGLQRMERR